MSDFEFVRSTLAQAELSKLKEWSGKWDFPYQTLYNLKRGLTKNPRIKTVEFLARQLKAEKPA